MDFRALHPYSPGGGETSNQLVQTEEEAGDDLLEAGPSNYLLAEEVGPGLDEGSATEGSTNETQSPSSSAAPTVLVEPSEAEHQQERA